MSCVASGKPKPHIRWLKNGEPVRFKVINLYCPIIEQFSCSCKLLRATLAAEPVQCAAQGCYSSTAVTGSWRIGYISCQEKIHFFIERVPAWAVSLSIETTVIRPEKYPRELQLVTAEWGRLFDIYRWIHNYAIIKLSPSLITKLSSLPLWMSTINSLILTICLVKWLKLYENDSCCFPQLDRKEMRFSSLTFDDSGMYQCIAENRHGIIYANAELRVFGESNFGCSYSTSGCVRHSKVTFQAD